MTIVALDGTAQSLTFGELDARANQWGRALAANGAGDGFPCRTCDPEFAAPGAGDAGVLEDRRGSHSHALGPARMGAKPGARGDRPRRGRRRTEPVGAGCARGRRVRKPAARSRFPHRQRNLQQRFDRRAESDPQPGAVALDALSTASRSCRTGRRWPNRRPSWCPRRCITPTASPPSFSCWPATIWWCSKSLTPHWFWT